MQGYNRLIGHIHQFKSNSWYLFPKQHISYPNGKENVGLITNNNVQDPILYIFFFVTKGRDKRIGSWNFLKKKTKESIKTETSKRIIKLQRLKKRVYQSSHCTKISPPTNNSSTIYFFLLHRFVSEARINLLIIANNNNNK